MLEFLTVVAVSNVDDFISLTLLFLVYYGFNYILRAGWLELDDLLKEEAV